MASLLKDCTIKELCFEECGDSITISAGLLADTNYKWRIIDAFGNKYTGEVITNSDGDLTIYEENFREGFFSKYQQPAILKLMLNGVQVPLTFDGEEFQQVTLLFNCSDVNECEEACYNLTIDNCASEIVIDGELEPETLHFWYVTDQFGNIYNGQADTDDQGILTIDVGELPEGLLFTGSVTVKIKVLYGAIEQDADLVFGEATYTCITVVPEPTIDIITFDLPVAMCEGFAAIALTPATPGGIFSGTGVVLDLGIYYFDPNISGVGTFIITYTLDGNNYTQSVVVHPLPVVTLNPFTDVCEDAAPFDLTGGFPAGGQYIGPGITTSPLFDPAAAGRGVHEIFYLYTDANGCANYASNTIEVIDCAASVASLVIITPQLGAPLVQDITAISFNGMGQLDQVETNTQLRDDMHVVPYKKLGIKGGSAESYFGNEFDENGNPGPGWNCDPLLVATLNEDWDSVMQGFCAKPSPWNVFRDALYLADYSGKKLFYTLPVAAGVEEYKTDTSTPKFFDKLNRVISALQGYSPNIEVTDLWWGAECNFVMSADEYVAFVNAKKVEVKAMFPGARMILDTISSGSVSAEAWNAEIITGCGDGFDDLRVYWQVRPGDGGETYSTYTSLRNRANAFPAFITQWLADHPGFGAAVCQLDQKVAMPLYATIAHMLYCAEQYMVIADANIANNDQITLACQFNMNGLFDKNANPDPQYYAIKEVFKIFGKNRLSYAFNGLSLSGCTAFPVVDYTTAPDTYVIIILNPTDVEQTLPDGITIDGVALPYTGTCYWGIIDDNDVNIEPFTTVIRPYSFTIITA